MLVGTQRNTRRCMPKTELLIENLRPFVGCILIIWLFKNIIQIAGRHTKTLQRLNY